MEGFNRHALGIVEGPARDPARRPFNCKGPQAARLFHDQIHFRVLQKNSSAGEPSRALRLATSAIIQFSHNVILASKESTAAIAPAELDSFPM